MDVKALSKAADDKYGATETPADRNSVDITKTILDAGKYSNVVDAWQAMSEYALGIHSVGYDYELPDNIDNHDANSNATALSVLNKVGVDIRELKVKFDGVNLVLDNSGRPKSQRYVNMFYFIQFPGASRVFRADAAGTRDGSKRR